MGENGIYPRHVIALSSCRKPSAEIPEPAKLPPEDVVVERDFGLMLSDFSRIFPRVWPQLVQLDDSSVSVCLVPSGSVHVTLSEQKFRKLATLRIPYLDIVFRFEGTNAKQRAEFFEDFERSFQKGGG